MRGLVVLRGDRGDRFADIADDAVVPEQGYHRHHARHRARRRKVEFNDPPMGDVRTDDQAFELTFMADIDGIFRGPRHLVAGLDPRRDSFIAVEAAATGLSHRAQNIVIGAAAAEVARQRRADLLARGNGGAFRVAPSVVKGDCLDHEARRAEAALQGVERHERPLYRMQRCPANSLDGRDRPAGDRLRWHQAAHDRHAVEQYGAGAADTGPADELGTGQPHFVADDIDQKRFGIVGQGFNATVDRYRAHRYLLWRGIGARRANIVNLSNSVACGSRHVDKVSDQH